MTYDAVQMKTARLELRITDELLRRIDDARGDVSRTRWVERALEKALSAADEGASASGGASARVAAASSPTSESGCPECGGPWGWAISPEGGYRICSDCGAREAS